METPVLYFYPLKPGVVSVHVGFPNGRITEWYPQASGVQTASSRDGWIEWQHVQLNRTNQPNGTGEQLPKLAAASHYYAARETGSWPLRSEGENEKLLFYRGIAYFAVDLRPVVKSDGVSLSNADGEAIPVAILFENHAGKIAYHVIHGLRDRVEIKFSDLGGSIDDLRAIMGAELMEMGLYRNE
jgi:hypothetical protein